MERLSGHATSVLASRAHMLYRINGDQHGQHYWAYALIDNGKLEAFMQAVAAGNILVQDYGRVLAWGQGSEPPESVRKELREIYNFDIIA